MDDLIESNLFNIPNKGTFVKEFTCKDIDEIFDMRVLLEGYAILRSHQNLTSQRIETLLAILREMEITYDAGRLEEYTRADEELHREIVALGNNSIVSWTYDRVGFMNQQFRVLSLSVRKRFEESLDEHRQTIHALIEGRAEEAEQCNRRHLELARACIKAAAAAATPAALPSRRAARRTALSRPRWARGLPFPHPRRAAA